LDGAATKLETSFTMEGNYRGIPCREVGTFTTVIRDGAVMYGEGQGISYLNNMVGVFEYEGDEMGNCSSKVWEWK
jgi:hypothetical protein